MWVREMYSCDASLTTGGSYKKKNSLEKTGEEYNPSVWLDGDLNPSKRFYDLDAKIRETYEELYVDLLQDPNAQFLVNYNTVTQMADLFDMVRWCVCVNVRVYLCVCVCVKGCIYTYASAFPHTHNMRT